MKRLLSLTLVAAWLSAAPAHAASFGPVPADPGDAPFSIGRFKAFSLRDAQIKVANDDKGLWAGVSAADVAKVLSAAGAPTDSLFLSVDALLVHTADRLVLLDTGLGPPAHGVLLQSLGQTGFAPGDVTDVLITHSHGDHVGGLVTAEGQQAFPKATVHMSSAEWTFMKSQEDTKSLVKAIAAQVQTFEAGAEVVPGFTAVAIKGHTPGHMAYEIHSGRDKLLDIGDSAHSSIVSLAKPGWVMGFDSDPTLAKASREKLLADLAKSHERIFSPHFPYPGVGHVARDGDHFVWRPAAPTEH